MHESDPSTNVANGDQRTQIHALLSELTGVRPELIVPESGGIWEKHDTAPAFTIFMVRVDLTDEQMAQIDAIFEE